MTTTSEQPAASPGLERPAHPYRGVCTALARTTGTDVLLWRVLFIVLTVFFNGLGIALYLIGLVTIPREGEAQSLGARLLRGPDRRMRGSDVLLLVLTVLSIGNVLNRGDGVIAFAVFVGLVALYLSSRGAGEPSERPPLVRPAEPAPMEPLPTGVTVRIGTGPRAPRPRSVLPALTLGTALLVSSFLVLLDTADVASIHAETVIAVALGIVGVGLVVSAWWGRALVLVPVAIVLGIVLAGTSIGWPAFDQGVGDRTWTPTGPAAYRLGVGDATLDLSDVNRGEPGVPTVITAAVDVGHLEVLVPAGLRVEVHATALYGDIQVFDQNNHGHHVLSDEVIGGEGGPQVQLDLSVRAGQVEVRRG